MIKAVVERVNQIAQVYGIENVRSPKYKSKQESEQFEQLLENERKKQKQNGIVNNTKAQLPEEYI